ncbi:hypothetical protein HPT29_025780 (plasmid) [Microvirga terrae]|uniref:Lactonase family protein n=1 Tax=Microvirga terrae TaxID=2740529 RepID=A0ABY5RZ82_9HYPH|nr:hypothetical protein [Microvirga terrae]UVF22555.1 hypothetical protein HPT29_025780 [Microvirga terrae]
MKELALPIAGLLAWAMLPAISVSPRRTDEAMPLQLEVKITVGNVKGRIDHRTVDVPSQRHFVAELGNNSVGVVDLSVANVSGRLQGTKDPQGVGYALSTGTLYVANAGDGSVRLFRRSLAKTGRRELRDDADNILIDSWQQGDHRLWQRSLGDNRRGAAST